MRKSYALIAVLLFFAACNHTEENKPDADRVIRDTVANVLLKDFIDKPASEGYKAMVEPKEESVPRQQNPSLLAAMRHMQTAPQHFSINATEDNSITGKEGTRISFKRNCFINKKGEEVKQTVDVQLKECYKLQDMLNENLGTTSRGTLLESKGMVCITAFYKGEELKLKSNEEMQVQFPFTFSANHDYSFFYGEPMPEDAVNWLPIGNTTKTGETALQEEKVVPPQFSYKNVDLEAYLKQFIQYPEEARRNELSSKVDAVIQIDAAGKVTNVLATSDYKTFRDDVTEQLMTMPHWQAARYKGRNIACSLKVSLDFNIRRSQQVLINVHNDEVSYYYNSSFNDAVQANGEGELYNASFNRLGWFNCARYLETKTEKADVVVRSDENADVKLVVAGRNSIIRGENFVGFTRFRNVPVGFDVKVLGVQYNNGIIKSFFQNLKLQKQNVISPDWVVAENKSIYKNA
ncbi:MAG: energy transducer TonB [Chitinophagales bacterium]